MTGSTGGLINPRDDDDLESQMAQTTHSKIKSTTTEEENIGKVFGVWPRIGVVVVLSGCCHFAY